MQNIPAIRFKAFDQPWRKVLVKEVLERVSDPVKVDKEEEYFQIGIRSHGKGIFYKEGVKGLELGDKRVFWVHENCLIVNIVFAWEQAIARTTSNEKGKVASHRFPMFRGISNISTVDYLVHFFLTKKGKMLLEIASPGGAGRNKTLGQKEFENLKLIIPSIHEQQKIASFLSTVDEKIQLLKKQQTHLELYKKGVMQKIFSRELRFKDENGKNFPEWEESTIKDVLTKQSSNISANSIEFNFGDHIIYGASGILKKVDFYEIEQDYISIVKDGAGVGRLLYCKGKSSVLGTLDILSPILSKVDARYIYYLLSTIDFTKYVTGSTIPHIYFRDYQKEKVQIPVKEEQQKIASFLSAIDEKIDHCKEQIRLTEEWKKGLLQQMFV